MPGALTFPQGGGGYKGSMQRVVHHSRTRRKKGKCARGGSAQDSGDAHEHQLLESCCPGSACSVASCLPHSVPAERVHVYACHDRGAMGSSGQTVKWSFGGIVLATLSHSKTTFVESAVGIAHRVTCHRSGAI